MKIINGDNMELHEKKCKACEGEILPLTHEEIELLYPSLDSAWEVVDAHHIRRNWDFNDFATALVFLNSAAEICEEEFHHADFEIGWGKVSAVIFTHKIDGLTESDFILASKFDQI
tara:strand:+ start:9773 stop:10120 length:348 start_codon:yes stop_codon:yes gene_type:complete